MPNPCTFTPIKENTLTRGKVILAIGSLDRYHDKGFDNLIKLISPVLKQHPDWMLKIVGKGEIGRAFLEELAIENGVEQQIIFTGFRKDVNDLMKGSEVFILSSRSEGLPMVLLEAMSQGMACIAYDCITGPSEMIINNQNGLLISDQDMHAMQTALVDLIEDEGLRRKLGQGALNTLNRYSLENVYNLWNNVFQQVM